MEPSNTNARDAKIEKFQRMTFQDVKNNNAKRTRSLAAEHSATHVQNARLVQNQIKINRCASSNIVITISNLGMSVTKPQNAHVTRYLARNSLVKKLTLSFFHMEQIN